jgi:hypothetical protein
MRRILLVFAVMAIVAVSVTPAFARSNHASSNADYGSNNPCYHKAYFQLPKCLTYL